tara:strand:- start:2478 stop:2705 length:228 start_codon:yes stop_codon:yes gene_type:complete
MQTTSNFLKTALDTLLTYTTPDNVARYIEMQSAMGNPPWKIKGKRIRKYKKYIIFAYPLNGVDAAQRNWNSTIMF